MFVRLGLTNSLRQLGRSLLVIIAMTLSAMSLTSALSYSQSHAKNSYQFYRQLLGGEILVSPVRWAGQQISDITDSGTLRPIKLPKTGLSWLEAYYPELYQEGFLGTSETGTAQVIPTDTLQQLLAEPGISGHSLQYQFPATLTNASLQTEKYVSVTVLPMPEPERLADLLQIDLAPYMHYLQSGQPFALVNAHLEIDQQVIKRIADTIPDSVVVSDSEEVRPTPEQVYARKLIAARHKAREDMQLPVSGELAGLRIPLLQPVENGEYLPDYSRTFTVEVPVLEQLAVPTRTIMFTSEMGDFDAETAYLHGGYVWLTQELWQQLWQTASSDATPVTSNLALQVANMDEVEQIVRSLQSKYPQFTFVSVADFAYRMESGVIIDRFYRVPRHLYQPGETRLAMPLDMGKLMGFLFYLIAGMLIMSRMLTGAAARRQEIGVLKALGARRRDIVTMVLTESLLVSVIGTIIGFLLVRIGGIMLELGNNVPWTTVLSRTCGEFGLIIGLASAISLLFSLIPASRMSNLTVMGVLRGE